MIMDAHEAMSIPSVGDAVRALNAIGYCPQAIFVGQTIIWVEATADNWVVHQEVVTVVIDPENYDTANGPLHYRQVVGVLP